MSKTETKTSVYVVIIDMHFFMTFTYDIKDNGKGCGQKLHDSIEWLIYEVLRSFVYVNRKADPRKVNLINLQD